MTGFSLVSAENEELQQFSGLPAFVKLSNGDDVHGLSSGETFSDYSRLIPIVYEDNPPGKWYKRLRLERQVFPDQVVVKTIYSDEPDLDDERAQMIVTPFQGRVALSNANLLTQVEALIADPAVDANTKIAWEYAIEWKRNSPMITNLMAALSISDTQADDLFKAAAQITA